MCNQLLPATTQVAPFFFLYSYKNILFSTVNVASLSEKPKIYIWKTVYFKGVLT